MQRIEKDCRESFSGIYPKTYDFSAMAHEFVNPARAREELARIARLLCADLGNKSLLEIGSGYGMFIAVAHSEFHMCACGIEPGEQFSGTYATSLSVLQEMGVAPEMIRQGYGEELPFENESFDIVYSSNVLEHVKNPAKIIAEALRVVRKDGYVITIAPNYGSWWEGHYGMFMLPYSPAWLLKIITRMMGRDTSYIDTLQLITHKKLEQWVHPLKDSVEVLNWGHSLWVERVRTLAFSEWAQLGKIKRLLRVIHFFKLTEIVILLGTVFHWETPFVLVFKKK